MQFLSQYINLDLEEENAGRRLGIITIYWRITLR